MNAWPQAVWIVKKLQANFNFNDELNYYTQQLNGLNSRINNLIDRVQADENELIGKTTTFVSKSINNTPENLPVNYGEGTIWLVEA